jgi:hypothetical protein
MTNVLMILFHAFVIVGSCAGGVACLCLAVLGCDDPGMAAGSVVD